MNQANHVFKLQGVVQHYAWGGTLFLPKLLSVPNPDNKHFAEYWLGAHDNAPSELVFGPSDRVATETSVRGPASRETPAGELTVKLNQYIRESPEATLGGYTAERFGKLPYLFKILDVKDMLSIQVHPTKEHAAWEFGEENRKGIALNAPNRNYKDDNHKPELMLALSEFWLLHGFKPPYDLKAVLQATPELGFLAPVFEQRGYQGLYKTVMEMEQAEVNSVLQPLLDRIIPAYRDQHLSRSDENFWAARAALTYNEPGRTDKGIFSIYFFNLLNLHPGEAVFQDAGLPHAYLEGQNVEIMANSDNVLRGGLTPKHVDVPELMKHIVFEATHPHIIMGDHPGGPVSVFPTPAPDFELSRISLLQGVAIDLTAISVEIFLVMEGEVAVEELGPSGEADGAGRAGEGGRTFGRTTGEAFIAFDRARLACKATKDTVVYRASVPHGRI
jgi:mannose-6-phosphate isomerase